MPETHNTYGDDMTYWEYTDEHPGQMSINEREAWHRDAWDREQVALLAMTDGKAGNDAPGSAGGRVRSFGYARSAWVHEQ